MLVTRTPLRIPLGGGGTDLPSYYSRYRGFLTTAAINKFVYIIVNRRFEKSFRVSYSHTEIVERLDSIGHPIVREAIRLVGGIESGLEIVSIADLPASSGLGSSSSFTVGLLNALHAYRGEMLSPKELADEACHIEMDILKEPVGKQDQYIAAFGGIRALDIDKDGAVAVQSSNIAEDTVDDFESSVLLFYTGVQRSASDVLGDQSKNMAVDEGQAIAAMHAIKDIGREIQRALETGDLPRFGDLLHKHWETKKRTSGKVSSGQIDRWYETARQNGAAGGKIMGAGGGGFFMFYCQSGQKAGLRAALAKEGLTEMRYAIEPMGSRVIVNI
jgi:D-glycero-alpha-D-manno-heptose-7-phosphate kinase